MKNVLSKHRARVIEMLKEGIGINAVANFFGVSRNAVYKFKKRWIDLDPVPTGDAGYKPLIQYEFTVKPVKKGKEREEMVHPRDIKRTIIILRQQKPKEIGLAVNKEAVLKDHKDGMPPYIIGLKYGVSQQNTRKFIKTHTGQKWLPATSRDPFDF